MLPTPINSQYKSKDMQLWEEYHRTHSLQARDALLKQFDGIIQAQVNKWSGSVSRQMLLTEAKVLAIKAFDKYNPNAGAALGTYLVNNLQPLSRLVYTHQNVNRIPENAALKMHTYATAVDNLKAYYGREPTTDELHQELGWSAGEISKLRDYQHKDLTESGPEVSGDFFSKEDDSDIILAGIYAELLPEEKTLFEFTTGYNNRPVLSNPEIMKRMSMSQAQLSYKKTLLTKKIKDIMKRHGL